MKDSRKSIVQGLFKGGSIIFVGLIIELFISFIAKILMARVLGQFDYGIATLGITILSFFSAILLLGLNNGVGRYLPRYDTEGARKGVILSALQVSLPLATLLGIGLVVFAEPVASDILRTPEATGVIQVAAVGLPFAVLLKLSIGVIQGMEQSVPKVLIRNIFQPLVRFGLIALVLLLGFGSLGIVWAYTLTFLLAGLAGAYYIATKTPVLASARSQYIHRELILFSAPLMLMTAMMMVLTNLDIFFLSYFQSPSDIGVYNVIYPLAELLTMTLSGFSFIFLPLFSRLETEGNLSDMQHIYQVVTKWILLLTLPGLFFFVLFPGIAIGITFGWEYEEGAIALVILSIGFVSHAVLGPNMNALTAIGRTRLVMYSNLIAAGINVILNYLLIPEFSYTGAAVATSASYFLLNVMYSAFLYRKTSIHPFTSQILRPGGAALSLIVFVFVFVELTLPKTVLTALGTFLIFSIAYVIVVLRFGAVQEEEVMLIKSVEERFGIDLSAVKNIVLRLID